MTNRPHMIEPQPSHSGPEAATTTPMIEQIRLLQRSNRTVKWVSYLLAVLAPISFLMLAYQSGIWSGFSSELPWSRPWFWMPLLGYFLGGCICSWLFICVRRYLRELKYLQAQPLLGLDELFQEMNRGWKAAGWCGFAVLGYTMLYGLHLFGLLQLPQISPSRSRSVSLPRREVKVEFRQADEQSRDGWIESHMTVNEPVRKAIFVANQAVVETGDIARASVLSDEDGNPCVTFEMTSRGAAKLRLATQDMIGQKLAIMVDNQVVSTPIVRDVLEQHIQVTGAFTFDEAQTIVDSVNGRAVEQSN